MDKEKSGLVKRYNNDAHKLQELSLVRVMLYNPWYKGTFSPLRILLEREIELLSFYCAGECL